MYKAVIEAHDLKEIKTEARLLKTLKNNYLRSLLVDANIEIEKADSKKMLDWCSITVTITRSDSESE